MTLTQKTHFNPCFWTALWNKNYYQNFIANRENELKCRNQKILTLNLKANKIIDSKTENVFFEKHTGLTDVTQKEIVDYCKKYFPEKTDYFENEEKYKDIHLVIDFENHFSILEDSFSNVFKLIRDKKIYDIAEKTELSHFVFTHLYRSPLHINKLIKDFTENDGSKLETFLHIKHNVLGNFENLKNYIIPIFSKEWTVLESKRYIPIGDNPIIHHKDNLFVTISPYLIIKIGKKTVKPEQICKYSKLSYFQYHSLLKLIITSSYNEIVADDKNLLEKIQKSKHFKNQVNKIKNKDHPYYK